MMQHSSSRLECFLLPQHSKHARHEAVLDLYTKHDSCRSAGRVIMKHASLASWQIVVMGSMCWRHASEQIVLAYAV